MNAKMYPVPFTRLLVWIKNEYQYQNSIFGIPAENFYLAPASPTFYIGPQVCSRPLGPAAGPHTQMTQNIIAAYLTGARFFELKTVQQIDNLEIAKPCISAAREGYNTEWSTEFSVPEAFDEYLKAWLLIPYVRKIVTKELAEDNDKFIFNMSVGYDLAGIRSPKIDHFIESMKSAGEIPQFKEYQAQLSEIENHMPPVSPNLSGCITLSTMHGCSPNEIESIANYLLTEKRLHTYIKLNPTLLGYDFVRSALDRTGYKHIHLKPASFERDLQFDQAVPILKRLQSIASKNNLSFGIKLSNTLSVINDQGRLPGDEMYLSGSALYPLTINLAFRLAWTFNGNLPISYSGGVDFFNIGNITATGIAPITVATNLLKPGGYLRLKQLAEEVDKHSDSWRGGKIDLELLARLAEQALPSALQNIYFESRPIPKIARALPLFDCFTAPCQEHCPIHQDVADYLRCIHDSDYDAALNSILIQNPLPNITGHICDHQCMLACTRNFYDEPVAIRDMKRIAAECGRMPSRLISPKISALKKVAIIGAGPAGLSTAYFLALAGLKVTIFDKNLQAGGTVRFVIPGFRLPAEAIERDIQFIASQGVQFDFNQSSDITIANLRQKGFDYIVLAIGAGISPLLPIQSENPNVIEAVEFLKKFNSKAKLNPGQSVAVIGGGNSAMDAAWAATKIDGVRKVFILYRRTVAQMPADREELENALKDGVILRELTIPVAFSKDGILKCQRMRLGRPDASGRPKPEPTDEFENLKIDTLITAIGEQVDQNYLRKIGFSPDSHRLLRIDPETCETDLPNVFIGGDARRGPATVVEAIADGRKIASAILKRENLPVTNANKLDNNPDRVRDKLITQKKGRLCATSSVFDTPARVQAEAERCLECDLLCARCSEVCPNRANIAITVQNAGHLFKNSRQIIHLDSLCNECGNCATFCLYENAQPYREKFTLFRNESDFANSTQDGFVHTNDIFLVRTDGQVWQLDLQKPSIPVINFLKNRQTEFLIKAIQKDYLYLFEV